MMTFTVLERLMGHYTLYAAEKAHGRTQERVANALSIYVAFLKKKERNIYHISKMCKPDLMVYYAYLKKKLATEEEIEQHLAIILSFLYFLEQEGEKKEDHYCRDVSSLYSVAV